MIVLNSEKAGRKYKIRQIIRYSLLGIFTLSAFFFLGIVFHDINTEDEEILFSEPKVEDNQVTMTPTKPESKPASNLPPETEILPQKSEEDWQKTEGAQLFYKKLAEIEEAARIEQFNRAQEQDKEDFSADFSQEELDKIYEEKLPEDIIVEDPEEENLTPEQQAAGYHIYHRHTDIKKLNIIPKYKPAYFGEEPVIAVVIDDMGIAKKRTADIISLQAPITASFLTYAKNLQEQIAKAQEAGMEIMLHTPMEPYSHVDIAPDVLTTQMSKEEVQTGLREMLKKIPEVKGINNHMGSKFTEDEERMQAVMEVLKEQNLFFLDSKTTPKSVGKKTAKENGVSYATRHVFIDNENKVPYVLKQLSIAEKIAKRNGYAIAIGHPKSATYQALKEWLPGLKDKKIKIISVSDIVKVLDKSHI